ncbi:peroxisome assembly per8 [Lecanosticta acicola]|uniref:Peroxisome assembly per8 n=1 Tax=Lecanosticta acicola TaxID=111012 RepID=A0AAI9EAN3_9PEZI|nr:peroxisome assembly per8 [Lecanosticta acicola]
MPPSDHDHDDTDAVPTRAEAELEEMHANTAAPPQGSPPNAPPGQVPAQDIRLANSYHYPAAPPGSAVPAQAAAIRGRPSVPNLPQDGSDARPAFSRDRIQLPPQFPPPILQPALSVNEIKAMLPKSTNLEDFAMGEECAICKHDKIEPCMTACKHAFCADCVVAWIRDRRWCPMCRQPAIIWELVLLDTQNQEQNAADSGMDGDGDGGAGDGDAGDKMEE